MSGQHKEEQVGEVLELFRMTKHFLIALVRKPFANRSSGYRFNNFPLLSKSS